MRGEVQGIAVQGVGEAGGGVWGGVWGEEEETKKEEE